LVRPAEFELLSIHCLLVTSDTFKKIAAELAVPEADVVSMSQRLAAPD
jgi:hypothetical protein